jgi:VWFA-related protein
VACGVLVVLGVGALAVAGGSAQQATFRSGVRTVAVYATVHGADGHLASGLDRTSFQILDNGRPVEISVFSNDIVPITVALMLDTSTSMGGEFQRVRQSAAEFVGQLGPDDRLRIGTFGDEVAVSPLLTGDKATLLRVIREEVWPGGETPLWTALDRGMRSLDAETGRRVILALTDGGNDCTGNRPCVRLPQVRAEAEAQGVMIYAIGMAGAPLVGDLVGLTIDTGGGHFNVASNVDLDATFAQVADELHHQYVLGFTPAALDGKLHTLEVKVSCAGCTARARNRYIAAGDR